MAVMHLFYWGDGSRTSAPKYPVCGQVNAHGVVIATSDPIPETVTCKRCLKRAAAAQQEDNR